MSSMTTLNVTLLLAKTRNQGRRLTCSTDMLYAVLSYTTRLITAAPLTNVYDEDDYADMPDLDLVCDDNDHSGISFIAKVQLCASTR